MKMIIRDSEIRIAADLRNEYHQDLHVVSASMKRDDQDRRRVGKYGRSFDPAAATITHLRQVIILIPASKASDAIRCSQATGRNRTVGSVHQRTRSLHRKLLLPRQGAITPRVLLHGSKRVSTITSARRRADMDPTILFREERKNGSAIAIAIGRDMASREVTSEWSANQRPGDRAAVRVTTDIETETGMVRGTEIATGKGIGLVGMTVVEVGRGLVNEIEKEEAIDMSRLWMESVEGGTLWNKRGDRFCNVLHEKRSYEHYNEFMRYI